MHPDETAAAAMTDDACNRIGELDEQIARLSHDDPGRSPIEDEIMLLRRRIERLNRD